MTVLARPVETRAQLAFHRASQKAARSVDELPDEVEPTDPACAFQIQPRASHRQKLRGVAAAVCETRVDDQAGV